MKKSEYISLLRLIKEEHKMARAAYRLERMAERSRTQAFKKLWMDYANKTEALQRDYHRMIYLYLDEICRRARPD